MALASQMYDSCQRTLHRMGGLRAASTTSRLFPGSIFLKWWPIVLGGRWGEWSKWFDQNGPLQYEKLCLSVDTWSTRSLVPFPTASKKPESTFSKEKEFENHTLASTLKLNGTPQHNTAIKFLSRKEHLKSAKSKKKYQNKRKWHLEVIKKKKKRVVTWYVVFNALGRDYTWRSIFHNNDLKNPTFQHCCILK